MRPQFPNVIFLFLLPFLSAKKGGKKAEEGKGGGKDGGKEGRNKHMVAEISNCLLITSQVTIRLNGGRAN